MGKAGRVGKPWPGTRPGATSAVRPLCGLTPLRCSESGPAAELASLLRRYAQTCCGKSDNEARAEARAGPASCAARRLTRARPGTRPRLPATPVGASCLRAPLVAEAGAGQPPACV